MNSVVVTVSGITGSMLHCADRWIVLCASYVDYYKTVVGSERKE